MTGLADYVRREEIAQHAVRSLVGDEREVVRIESHQHNSGYVNFPYLGGGSFSVTVYYRDGQEMFFVKRDSDFNGTKYIFHKLVGKKPKTIPTEAKNLEMLMEVDIAPRLLRYDDLEKLFITEHVDNTSVLETMNNGLDISAMIYDLGRKYAHLHSIGLEGRDYRIDEHMKINNGRIVVLDWGTRDLFESGGYIGEVRARANLLEMQVALHYEFKNSHAFEFWNAFIRGYNNSADVFGIRKLDLDFAPPTNIKRAAYYNLLVPLKHCFYKVIRGK